MAAQMILVHLVGVRVPVPLYFSLSVIYIMLAGFFLAFLNTLKHRTPDFTAFTCKRVDFLYG